MTTHLTESQNSKQPSHRSTKFASDTVSLDASNNQIEQLPNSLNLLAKLEYFYFNNLHIDQPKSFDLFKNLKILNLASNNLKKLPDSFGQLRNLEHLTLSNNKLENLPISCAMLQRLSNLNLCNNQLPNIPECITGGMKNLRILDVSNNYHIIMNKSPASIHLTTFLAKNNNNCKIFPQWILWIKYSQLKEINLDNTWFDYYYFPTEKTVLEMNRLSMKQAGLSDIHIEKILTNLLKLEYLDLSNSEIFDAMQINSFEQMPTDNLKEGHCLKEINVSGTNLPWISEKIGKFNNLIKLDMSYNSLSWLPKEFTLLQNLQVLKIQGNKMIELPEDIDELINLRELWASDNNLSCLPNSLFNLRHLKILDLYNNNILKVSKRISEMNSLEKVDMERNYCRISQKVIDRVKYERLKTALRNHLDYDTRILREEGVKIRKRLYQNRQYQDGRYQEKVYQESKHLKKISLKKEIEDYNSRFYANGRHNFDARSPHPNFKSLITSDASSDEDEEDWNVRENKGINFVPHEARYFRPNNHDFHMLKYNLNNNYCPANDHTTLVADFLDELNLSKNIPTIIEGQFDDA